jgi:hypothetical protein
MANPSLTRRRALFGVAPALALAAIPVAAMAMPTSPDAELLSLAVEWRRLEFEIDRLDDEIEAAGRRAEDAYPPIPTALHRRPDDQLGLASRTDGPLDAHELWIWREAKATNYTLSEAERIRLHARADEIEAAVAAHEAARRQVRERMGLPALYDRQCDLSDRQTEIETATKSMPARTASGVAFKAELVERYRNLHGEEHFADLLDSLLADLRRAGDA